MKNDIDLILKHNQGKLVTLPKDAQVCSFCLKAKIVPLTSQENNLTIKIYHHYGSPKDGTEETFDMCLECYNSLIKREPIKTKYIGNL